MHILIAPDKFKGTLTACEVCASVRKGILKVNANLGIVEIPMADGGEGSIELLRETLSLKPVDARVRDPLGRPMRARYYRKDGEAFIGMDAASGLGLLTREERNPMLTSSYGTGLMIADALGSGAREISLFIGGSATNDGGMGVASALGYRFLDAEGHEIEPIGKNLGKVHFIDKSGVNRSLEQARTRVICDVENPFYGPEGAAHVYAAQKGAAPQDILALDAGLRSFAAVVKRDLGIDLSNRKGAGAAGGLGGGAIAFLDAQLVHGIDFMMDILGIEEAVRSSGLVITGEGRIDQQTLYGKVVSGIARLAKKHDTPCIAFCGVSQLNGKEMDQLGLIDIVSMSGGAFSLQESLAEPARVLEEVVRSYFSDQWLLHVSIIG